MGEARRRRMLEHNDGKPGPRSAPPTWIRIGMLVKPEAHELLDKGCALYNGNARALGRNLLPFGDYLLTCFIRGQAALLEADRQALKVAEEKAGAEARALVTAGKVGAVNVIRRKEGS